MITAPFDGALSAAAVTEGTLVRSGQNLGTFIESGRYEVEIPVAASYASFLAVGKPVVLTTLSGDKIIEVVSSSVNKGTAAAERYNTEAFDFVLAVGDDVTDEDVFTYLPSSTVTIKVGNKPTAAHYRVADSTAFIEFLGLLSRAL